MINTFIKIVAVDTLILWVCSVISIIIMVVNNFKKIEAVWVNRIRRLFYANLITWALLVMVMLICAQIWGGVK